MTKEKKIKKLKYNVSFIPKSGHAYLEGSIGKISRLDLKRGNSYFDFKIIYFDDEIYNIKYNFKDKSYKKSFIFKGESKVINKKNIPVHNKKEINDLNLFVAEHFRKIIDKEYILENNSPIGLENLTSDIEDILRFIF